MLQDFFFTFFLEFQLLTKLDYFAKAVVHALWPLLLIFKKLSFLEYQVFLVASICTENLLCAFTVAFKRFIELSFLNQFEHFVNAIAHALWPILLIFKKLSFLEYQVFFVASICTENLLCTFTVAFKRFIELSFLNQFEHFAKAIAHELWPILLIFKKLWISGVFWSRLLHSPTLMCFYSLLLNVLKNFYFWTNLSIS